MECLQCGATFADNRTTCPLCDTPLAQSSHESSDHEHHSVLAEANLLRLREQYDDAISVCTRILHRDPSNAAAHSLLGDIYRAQRNYREAMGWYKLAVQLNPDSQSDRKKLDEMIDLVFRGASGEDGHAVAQPAIHSQPQAPRSSRRLGPLFRAVLLKVQPVHVVIAFTVLFSCAMLTYALLSGRHEQRAKTKTGAVPAPMAGNENATGSAVVSTDGQPLQFAPPPSDSIESGGNNTLRFDVSPRKATESTPPPTSAGNPAPPVTVGSQSDKEIPPFRPSSLRSGSGQVDVAREKAKLRASFEQVLRESRVSSTFNEVIIDPRTLHVTCDYSVSAMSDNRNTKEALLYTGFELIWTATQESNAFKSFTLRGNMTTNSGAMLALVADVTAEQAALAYNAKDYRMVESCLTNPWWHPDLASISF